MKFTKTARSECCDQERLSEETNELRGGITINQRRKNSWRHYSCIGEEIGEKSGIASTSMNWKEIARMGGPLQDLTVTECVGATQGKWLREHAGKRLANQQRLFTRAS